jgi:tRNA A-37 threonylcarbamoyl transferase component Bud32
MPHGKVRFYHRPNRLIDASLSKRYPPVKTEKLFGLLVKNSKDPRIASERKILMGVCGAGAAGLNALVLLYCLPIVTRKSAAKARNMEAKADELATIRPSESFLLYTKALKYVVDASHESILKNKIESFDATIRSGTSQPSASIQLMTPPASAATGTVVLPRQKDADLQQQEGFIGPDGRYRIDRPLGQGAMGIVFLAKDQLLLRDIALKKLTMGPTPNKDVAKRFQQEARALARLSHPNIIQIYDFIEEEMQNWIAMEYVEGQDLESLLHECGKFSLQEALKIGIGVAEAMAYAHNRGVVHRDFKPSNVLITLKGIPKVMDFGLAKLAHSSIATVEGSVLGSPAFMSPEQAKGEKVDERSDIYALGVTLYQLLTGRLPFEGDLKTVLTQKITGERPPLEPIASLKQPLLEHLIEKMVDNAPDGRPANMEIVCQRVNEICNLIS